MTKTTKGPISWEFTQRNKNSEDEEFVFIEGGAKASDQGLVVRVDQTSTCGSPASGQDSAFPSDSRTLYI